ncbi:MAG TPA: maleylpyruvate isomerase N-terminal domain-containing protein [Actinomycetota bacterium]|nr:maleylpyruvate isomerase N-terminal domain-containing protein [Actinomycetota bacterium]
MALTSRAEAVRILEEGHATVQTLLANVGEEDFVRLATIGGGEWSAKDLVGHLATWEEAALEALGDWRAGRTPTIETEVFARPGAIDEYNARTVAAKRDEPLDAVRRAVEEAHAAILSEIEGMSDDEWSSKAPYPSERRRRLAELLGSITGAPKRPFGHAFAHIPDLEAFRASLLRPAQS